MCKTLNVAYDVPTGATLATLINHRPRLPVSMHIHIAFPTRPLAVIRARALALGHGCRYVSQQLWQTICGFVCYTPCFGNHVSLYSVFFSFPILFFDRCLTFLWFTGLAVCRLSLVWGSVFVFFWHWSGTYAGSALRWLVQYWERDTLLSLQRFLRRSC